MSERIGVIGLAVMGENLVLNLADHGASVAVYNRTAERTRKFSEGAAAGRPVHPTYSLAEMAGRLERPRRVLLMVKAGPPVDAVLEELVPHLEPGDLVIDGGNSHFRDTERRAERLAERGLHYVGMGISGGEEGARHGPSLMPGGPRPAYEQLEPILKRIAAQTDSGPCVTHVGVRGAGHLVKMVHNGIEYGDMQLIAEAYDLLRHGAGIPPAQLAEVFDRWNQGELRSYLIEITARVVAFPDDQGTGDVLIDRIDDRAGQKGTGKWTTQAALDLGVPVPTITAAVDARLLSSLKDERRKAAEVYRGAAGRAGPAAYPGAPVPAKEVVNEARQGLYAAKVCSYAQGFALLATASRAYGYGLDLGEIARVWKGGCIIRAALLDRIRAAFRADPGLPNLLLDPGFAREITERLGAWRHMAWRAQQWGIPAPTLSASLAYFDGYRSPRLPANLLQAKRDYFGAHTYERTDSPGIFHTDWTPAGGK
ncbi:MAG: NADP-dependent phosphogluconate dehydrogenase [Gemmataceae bacterium]|nr:NADP-dependent phosphogluconate dehydrogenase [Gemmataceae bacterium]